MRALIRLPDGDGGVEGAAYSRPGCGRHRAGGQQPWHGRSTRGFSPKGPGAMGTMAGA